MADVGEIRGRLVLSTEKWDQSMSKAKGDLGNLSKSSQSLSREMGSIQKASLAMGSAVVGAIGASVGVAANFEHAMARVGAVSGATGSDFEALEAQAKALGESTMFSATQAAEGMQYLAMAGFEVSEIIGAMPAVLDLAAASQIDLGRASDIVSNIMTGFGISAEDTGQAVDVLVKTMTTANTDLPMLGEAMKYVSPVAASLGLSIEETAAAVAKMSDAGIQGSQAGTALRAALLSLANPTGQTADAMEALGINVLTADGAMKPLPELIGHIAETMGGMTEAQRTQAAAQLVGTEAASGFIALLEIGEEGLRDYVSELENAGGTAERVATTQMDTLKGAFIEFQSAVEGLGIKIGDDLLPVFSDIVRYGTDIVRGLGEMDGAAVKSGLAFAGTAATIGLVLSSISKLGIAMRTFALSPVGAAITGLSILGGLLVAARMESDAYSESTMERINEQFAEAQALEGLTNEYDSLRGKLHLSNDELGRYLDITKLISQTSDPTAIARLREEQDQLQEKSGLTNEELSRFLDVNQQIIDEVPESNVVLTEQGDIFLANADAAKKLTQEKYEQLRLDLEIEKNNTMVKMKDAYVEQEALLKNINDLYNKRQENIDAIDAKERKVAEAQRELQKAKLEGDDLEIFKAEAKLLTESDQLDVMRIKHGKLLEEIQAQEESLDLVNKEIGKLDEVNRKMVELEMKQVGLNSEKGKEIETIDKAVQKLEAQKKKLQETTPLAQRNSGEYAEAVSHIDNQISSLNGVKSRISEIIGQAGSMNAALGKSIRKDVIIRQVQGQTLKRMPGLDYHTGGIVGREQMPKLHTGGLASQLERFANMPNHNEVDTRLLRNEMVLTESQQANLMRMIDAGLTANSGDGLSGELADIVRAMQGVSDRPIQLAVNVDGHQVAEATYPYIDMKMANQMSSEMYRRGIKG